MTTNEVLNRAFDEAEYNGLVKRITNSDVLACELRKAIRKDNIKWLFISILLSAISLFLLILFFMKIRIRIISAFLLLMLISPLLVLISNHKSKKNIKRSNYRAFICTICEKDKDYAYIKGISKEYIVSGVQVKVASELKDLNVGDKVIAIIIGNDFYTIPYNESLIRY